MGRLSCWNMGPVSAHQGSGSLCPLPCGPVHIREVPAGVFWILMSHSSYLALCSPVLMAADFNITVCVWMISYLYCILAFHRLSIPFVFSYFFRSFLQRIYCKLECFSKTLPQEVLYKITATKCSCSKPLPAANCLHRGLPAR